MRLIPFVVPAMIVVLCGKIVLYDSIILFSLKTI